MAEMSKHVEYLEQRQCRRQRRGQSPGAGGGSAGSGGTRAAEITEEELLAISAAIGAYLGVRAHIRQIRLVSTSAWAQQGRVSIQASHRLQG